MNINRLMFSANNSNQKKIRHFYNEFGIYIPENPQVSIFTTDIDALYSSLDYIYEYIHDYTEIMDEIRLSKKRRDKENKKLLSHKISPNPAKQAANNPCEGSCETLGSTYEGELLSCLLAEDPAADVAGSEGQEDIREQVIALTNIKYSCIGMCLIMGIDETMYSRLVMTKALPFDVQSLQKQYAIIREGCINHNYGRIMLGIYELESMIDAMIIDMGYNPSGILNMMYERNIKKLLRDKQRKKRVV